MSQTSDSPEQVAHSLLHNSAEQKPSLHAKSACGYHIQASAELHLYMLAMQLHHLQKSAAAAHVQAAAAKHAPSARPLRCKRIISRYQNDDDIGAASIKAEVSAEGTYRAAAANMPEGAWAGRWERWAPPAEGFKGGIFRADEVNSGWQLLTSGTL